MLYLNVPYKEKEEAKKLGALWNPEKKKWFVQNRCDYSKFNKWIVGDLDYVHVLFGLYYLVVGKRKCYKCKKNTTVISFAVEKFGTYINKKYVNEEIYSYFGDNSIHFINSFSPLEKKMEKFLLETYNYHLSYSKTMETTYLANNCQNCDSLQGDYFLYNEPDSPFFLNSIQKIKDLTFYKIILENDMIVEGEIDCSSYDDIIKKTATIKNLTI